VSAVEQQREARFTATDAVAGFLAAASVVLSAVAMDLFFFLGVDAHPARTAPIAVVLAILAGVMSARFGSMSRKAMFFAASAWAIGMTVAVLIGAPLF
jgi:hypothetical protein